MNKYIDDIELFVGLFLSIIPVIGFIGILILIDWSKRK